jgi:hypothetical protein
MPSPQPRSRWSVVHGNRRRSRPPPAAVRPNWSDQQTTSRKVRRVPAQAMEQTAPLGTHAPVCLLRPARLCPHRCGRTQTDGCLQALGIVSKCPSSSSTRRCSCSTLKAASADCRASRDGGGGNRTRRSEPSFSVRLALRLRAQREVVAPPVAAALSSEVPAAECHRGATDGEGSCVAALQVSVAIARQHLEAEPREDASPRAVARVFTNLEPGGARYGARRGRRRRDLADLARCLTDRSRVVAIDRVESSTPPSGPTSLA